MRDISYIVFRDDGAMLGVGVLGDSTDWEILSEYVYGGYSVSIVTHEMSANVLTNPDARSSKSIVDQIRHMDTAAMTPLGAFTELLKLKRLANQVID